MKVVVCILFFLIVSCSYPSLPLVKTELLFGLYDHLENKPVSSSEWESFVKNSIQKEFPKGFTILNNCMDYQLAQKFGDYTEDCRMIVFLHPQNRIYNQKFSKIITTYRWNFHQEAVLRLDSLIRMESL